MLCRSNTHKFRLIKTRQVAITITEQWVKFFAFCCLTHWFNFHLVTFKCKVIHLEIRHCNYTCRREGCVKQRGSVKKCKSFTGHKNCQQTNSLQKSIAMMWSSKEGSRLLRTKSRGILTSEHSITNVDSTYIVPVSIFLKRNERRVQGT